MPLNSKGKSLLVGNIYCAHCGWRLTLTTSGSRKKVMPDGTVQKEAKIRYECHYNIRHPGECDGQSGYAYQKVDRLVEQVIRMKFAEIKEAPAMEIIEKRHRQELEALNKRITAARKRLAEQQAKYDDLKAEAIKVIRGQSEMSMDFLNAMVREAEAALNTAQANLDMLEQQKTTLEVSNRSVKAEYEQLLTWADMYDECSLEAKKMIVSQLIKSVRVGRGYNMEIEFNISFEDFQRLVSTSEAELKALEPPKEEFANIPEEAPKDEDLPTWNYDFTEKIVCGNCGRRYVRKTSGGKVKWICPTYNKQGKAACPSQAIPHGVLANLLMEMPYTELTEIKTEKEQSLIFRFKDGTQIIKQWQHRSRSASWTRSKRKAAQQRAAARAGV